MHVPKVTADVAASWTAEGATITASDPTISENLALPKKLAALTTVSNELLEDSNPEIMNLLTDNMTRSLALALDLAFYEGTGASNQPTGLRNVSGITLQSAGTNGAAPTLDLVATGVYQLYSNNAVPTAITMHRRAARSLRSMRHGCRRS